MDAPAGVLDPRHRLTTAGLLMLVTFVAFESMAVATAMPTAVAELDGLVWYGWPFTAFLVAQVVGMVVGGDVGDRRGPRVALLWGVGVFAAGLLACGLAADMALFVAGRAVQGFGGGLIGVCLYLVAGQAYDEALRPRLFGAIAAAWVLPALVGPLVAGLVTSAASWRWVFLGLLPLIAVGLALVLPALRGLPVPADPPRPARARHWWALLAGAGVALLQYAGQRLDAFAAVLAVAGLTALVLGLRPLFPPGTARLRRGLPTVVAARGLLAGAFFGVDTLLPLALTAVHGYRPTAAGVPLTAGAVGWALASQWQGRHPGASRVRLLRAGFVLVAIGLAFTAVVAVPGVGGWPAYLTWGIAGLGMGLGMPSLSVLLLAASPEHRRGADSAALQIADVTGSALCIGLTGVLVAAATAGAFPLRVAVLVVVAGYAALAVLGALVSRRAAGPLAQPAASADAVTLVAP
ncbi:Predicted arabinose efflux permease, MFS family [Modestobacter sp. DSM 44400]|uniref:MFS transporter n=1 Tax=Modestobacter sp. DSM 44400 TaxID=1550230 RepID=UPI000898D047|nr:MFS transporter [Modestobacter sp. DSM 44400]SDX66615.1 Predicted arabinose efflux permease, MFS family [Modestobacter sp. DSM 44400]